MAAAVPSWTSANLDLSFQISYCFSCALMYIDITQDMFYSLLREIACLAQENLTTWYFIGQLVY